MFFVLKILLIMFFTTAAATAVTTTTTNSSDLYRKKSALVLQNQQAPILVLFNIERAKLGACWFCNTNAVFIFLFTFRYMYYNFTINYYNAMEQQTVTSIILYQFPINYLKPVF